MPPGTAWRLRRLVEPTGRSFDWLYKHAPIAILCQFEHCELFEKHLESGQPMRWHPDSDMSEIDRAEASKAVQEAASYRPRLPDDELID